MSTSPPEDSHSHKGEEPTTAYLNAGATDPITTAGSGSERETVTYLPATGSDGFDEDTTKNATQRTVRQKEWPEVPGFEILGELGRGGMGVVYRARQINLKRVVALKMILSGAHARKEDLDRFKAEAEAVARLQHPNIVQVFEVGEHKDLPYLVLEYVDGGSLRDAVSGSPQSPLLAAGMVEQLAMAMEAAHRCGVIHRDLKPANILLSLTRPASSADAHTAGQRLDDSVPKITDFGLAKRLDEDSAQTRTGQVLGTPSYMAPEQAAGQIHSIGPATDVYSLGAVLYDLLTGRPPFKGASVQETIEQVRNQEPVRPTQLQPKVPRDLETICLKCLHKEPGRRYASAEHLAADLHRFRANKPILARPVGRPERLWRWCRRNPVIATLTGLAAIFLAVMIGVLAWANLTTSKALLDTEKALEREKSALSKVEGEKVAANAARLKAEAAETSEKKARRETEEKLVRLTVSNGNRCWDDGDPAGALLHFLFALDRDPDQAAMHRLRAGMALQDCTRLGQLGFHTGAIHQVAFSPDGRMIITGSDDNLARVWDVETGRLLTELRHPAAVSHAFFHPVDKGLVLTATTNGEIQVWQVATGQTSGPRLDLRKTPFHVAFSPDGSRIIAASGDKYGTPEPGTPDQRIFQGVGKPPIIIPGRASRNPIGRALIWEARTGEPGGRFGLVGWFNQAVFSPDGKRVATAGARGTTGLSAPGEARVWDLNGTAITPPLVHRNEVNSAAFSPDGLRLVTTSGPVLQGRGEARLWDAVTGALIGRPMPHELAVTQATFSPDGLRVLTGSRDGTARVWDAATGEPLGPFLRHNGELTAALFSPDGSRVLTASQDGAARVWDAASGQPLGPVLHHSSPVTTAAFSPDGQRLATATQEGVARLWDLAANYAPPRRIPTAGPALTALLTADGRYLLAVSGRHGNSIRTYVGGSALAQKLVEPDSLVLWDMTKDAPVCPPLPYQGQLTENSISADGKRLVTLGVDATRKGQVVAHVRLLPDGTPECEPLVKPGLSSVQFVRDGRALAVTVVEKPAPAKPREKVQEILVWDVARKDALGPVISIAGQVGGAFLNADGNILVTLEGTTVRLWNVASGRETQDALRLNQPVDRVEFGAGGQRLLIVANPYARDQEAGPTARVWEPTTRSSVLLQHPGNLRHATFSPEADRVATAGFDHTARIWSATTGKPLTPPLRHQGVVIDLAFSRDGRLLATASDDRTARVWDATTGEPLTMPLKHGGIVRGVTFATDAGSLVTASENGEVRVWDLPREPRSPQELTPLAGLLAGRRLDDTGGLIPIGAGDLERSWPAISRSHAAELTSAPKRADAWRHYQAEEAERRNEWFAAAVLLGELIRAEPGAAPLHLRRGHANAEAGRWDHAANDFAEVVRLKQENEDVLRALALTRLAAGRAADYRTVCKTLLERLGRPIESKLALSLVRACVLAPNAVPDYGPLVAAAEKLSAEKSAAINRFDVLGAVLVRAGRFDDAVQRLTPPKDGTAADNVWNWLFLALAYESQGKADKAAPWKEKAARWLDETPRGLASNRDALIWSRLSWEDRLALRLLQRETETVAISDIEILSVHAEDRPAFAGKRVAPRTKRTLPERTFTFGSSSLRPMDSYVNLWDETAMRILFIGDIVGTPGVNVVKRALPMLRASEAIDFVVANAENASAGSGMYPSTYRALRDAGIDAFTMGDHIYKKSDIIPLMQDDQPICKPANYPAIAPGKDHLIVESKNGIKLAVISLMGRTFMKPVDCPFAAVDRVLKLLAADVRCILVDIHAEATADKYLMLHHLRGRVGAVIGTHTHVPTADEQVLDGTAFLCDVGMTGPYGGILGRRVDRVLSTAITCVPTPFDVASEDPRLGAVLIEIDEQTGKASGIRRVMIREGEINT